MKIDLSKYSPEVIRKTAEFINSVDWSLVTDAEKKELEELLKEKVKLLKECVEYQKRIIELEKRKAEGRLCH